MEAGTEVAGAEGEEAGEEHFRAKPTLAKFRGHYETILLTSYLHSAFTLTQRATVMVSLMLQGLHPPESISFDTQIHGPLPDALLVDIDFKADS